MSKKKCQGKSDKNVNVDVGWVDQNIYGTRVNFVRFNPKISGISANEATS